jgi:hypothetical protein
MGAANEADLIDNLYGEAILEHLFALALAYYPFIKTRSLCEKGSSLLLTLSGGFPLFTLKPISPCLSGSTRADSLPKGFLFDSPRLAFL